MPVRLRITLLFAITVFTILLVVCGTVYYISYTSRINFIKTRLTNRAINSANFFKQSEVFNSRLIQKIDTSTAGSVRDKEIQVFSSSNQKIYSFSDKPADTLTIDSSLLTRAREQGTIYFTRGKKDAMALYFKDLEMVIVSATNDEAGRKNLSQLLLILLASLVGGLIISLGGGYFFSGRLLMPVIQIADEVNEISARNLTRRIKTGQTQDEWYYLSETLNKLLNRLQESFEVQRRFISNASHELCTPLTSISSQLEVSLQRERTAIEYRQVIHSTLQDVVRMNSLTQTLLELAKASGNHGGLDIQSVRVDEVILRLPAAITKLNNGWSVSLEFDNMPADENSLLVYGNEDLLFTAVKNIVINACKYSGDHRAQIRLLTHEKSLIIQVEDKGQGIASGDLENIFLPFYRAASGTEPGFGLGLSLANHIIKLHKGIIKIKSVVNSGTMFSIILPSAISQ